jgi:tRNA (mo5U34)-methyltransferase
MSKQQIISHINWFHRIDLGEGVVTPGDDDSAAKLTKLKFPEDLTGKTFLDIGAWDGFFSFEAERRGASRVLATDSFVWDGNVPGKSKEGFLTARSLLNSNVEDMHIDPLNVSPQAVGMWDVVLLAGVLYHLKHPWLLIERAASVTRELLIVETATDLNFMRRPAITIYTRGELAGDQTSLCAPNVAGLKAMLSNSGFRRVNVVYNSGLTRSILSAGMRFLKFGSSPFTSIQQGRCAVHSFR